MKQDQYIYAVTRIHNQEQGLFNQQDMEQLLATRTARECFQLLEEKGWGDPSLPREDPDALLAYEMEKTWNLLAELVEEVEVFHVLRSGIDFHNLKAAIKLVYSSEYESEHSVKYFRSHGTVPLDSILYAAREHDFSQLPEALAEAGKRAYEVLAHTASGQACDMVIDYASLLELEAVAEKTPSQLLKLYARITADVANIKAAVRACRMKRDQSFLERAIAPAGSLDTEQLIQAAQQGEQAIYDYLSDTEYAEVAQTGNLSMSAFERWCDNLLMKHIRPQKYRYEGIDPLAAFVLARENEIAMVRLVLSVKINKLDDAVARERLRDMYV